MTPDVDTIAPDFELVYSMGATRTLSELVANRPRVLIFYRGHL